MKYNLKKVGIFDQKIIEVANAIFQSSKMKLPLILEWNSLLQSWPQIQ